MSFRISPKGPSFFISPTRGMICRPGRGYANKPKRAWAASPTRPQRHGFVGGQYLPSHFARQQPAPSSLNGQAQRNFFPNNIELSWLPEILQQALLQCSTLTELSAFSLLPVFLATVGAGVGSGVVLETPVFSIPVNATLSCLFCGEDNRHLKRAIDEITKPLRNIQDERLVQRGEVRFKDIEKQMQIIQKRREAFYGGTPFRDPTTEAIFRAQMNQLQRLRRVTLIVENRSPGSLYSAAACSRGQGLLVLYDDPALTQMLDSLKKSLEDIDLLSCAYDGRTPDRSLLPESVPLVRPVVGCVIACRRATLGRLLCLAEPNVGRWVNNLVLAGSERWAPLDAKASEVLIGAWDQLIRRLLARRDSGEPQRVTLTAEATGLLSQYLREIAHSPSAEGRWVGSGPLLSAKIALNMQACQERIAREISSSLMGGAIALAKRLVQRNAAAACSSLKEEQGKLLEEKATRMLEKLQNIQPTTPRQLFRHYDNPSKNLHQPVLEHLMRSGQVQLRADGLLESCQATK